MKDAVKVDVQRQGRRFEAEALLHLNADPKTVWETITDYPGLPRFMPGIRYCRVVDRKPMRDKAEKLVVEQHGEFRFMVFAQSMKVTLDIEHEHMRTSVAKAIDFELGLLRRQAIDVFEGRYELVPAAGRRHAAGVHLRYSAVIGLRMPPPPAVGSMAVQQNLSAQLQAVAAEITRRGGGGGDRR